MFHPIELSGAPIDPQFGRSCIFEEPAAKSYVTACILLTLIFGIGWRAWQMQEFMANDLSQLPHYTGTERRIVIIDSTLSFYGADLVQNDPWLRGDVIRMYSHGAAADAKMMGDVLSESSSSLCRQIRYGLVRSVSISRLAHKWHEQKRSVHIERQGRLRIVTI